MPIHTVFLDAGGILVYPNWTRVSETMERHGVLVTAQALSDAEPRAKQRLDRGETIQGTNDEQRGWTYFDLVLTEAGVPLTASTAAALMELNAYHRQFNLWETVPDEVPPALAALRARGLRLVVVSNANGTLHRAFDRLGLASLVDVVFDSYVEKVEKPDPRFFQIALDRAGASAASTIHVGDIVEYLANVHTWFNAKTADFLVALKGAVDVYGGNLLAHTIVPCVTDVAYATDSWTPKPALIFGGSALGMKGGQAPMLTTRPHNDLWATIAQAYLGADALTVLAGEKFYKTGVAPIPDLWAPVP